MKNKKLHLPQFSLIFTLVILAISKFLAGNLNSHRQHFCQHELKKIKDDYSEILQKLWKSGKWNWEIS
jgi:hypothetical protein